HRHHRVTLDVMLLRVEVRLLCAYGCCCREQQCEHCTHTGGGTHRATEHGVSSGRNEREAAALPRSVLPLRHPVERDAARTPVRYAEARDGAGCIADEVQLADAAGRAEDIARTRRQLQLPEPAV